MPEIVCVQEANAFIGEGPCWHLEEQRLYWLDVSPHRPAVYALPAPRSARPSC